MRAIPLLATTLLVCGCGILGPDVETPGRRLLEPVPAEYPFWYADVEVCLAASGDFSAANWYVADDVILDGEQKAGVTEFPHDITVTSATDQRSVKHEMVHHILQRGNDIHDTPAFDCADFITILPYLPYASVPADVFGQRVIEVQDVERISH
jgi:hypothetical protein